MAVFAQQFQCRGFGDSGIFLGIVGVYLRDSIPGNIRDGFAAGDRLCHFNLNRIHAGNVVHDNAHRTMVGNRNRRVPLSF